MAPASAAKASRPLQPSHSRLCRSKYAVSAGTVSTTGSEYGTVIQPESAISPVYPASTAYAALRLPVSLAASTMYTVPASAPATHCSAISRATKRSMPGSAPVRIHSFRIVENSAATGILLGYASKYS